MLNRIEIKGLYGHYTYDLPLSSGQRKDICFLTGPNGYGKSTILDLVYAFIKADAKTLVEIPYDTITFYLRDYNFIVSVPLNCLNVCNIKGLIENELGAQGKSSGHRGQE